MRQKVAAQERPTRAKSGIFSSTSQATFFSTPRGEAAAAAPQPAIRPSGQKSSRSSRHGTVTRIGLAINPRASNVITAA